MMDCAEDLSDKLEGSGLIYAATWRTMGDERVRPQVRRKTKKGWKTSYSNNGANHMAMEGVTVKAGDLFDLGNGVKAKAPSKSGDAANDCNCRCFLEYNLMTPEEFAKAIGKRVDNSGESGIIKSGSAKIMNINSIDSPIEQRNTGKGNPNAILMFDRPLNNRQQKLLDSLNGYNSRLSVPKRMVSMKDLSALTATTGDEFALFTKGKDRLIIRGNSTSVNIDKTQAIELNKQGYRWSGHTHPGTGKNCLMASPGDVEILKCFRQKVAYIYNSQGVYLEFGKE